jgi:hypothetical protein
MSIAIDADTPDAATTVPVAAAARDMRETMGAVKVSFRWFGTRRSLSDNQTRQAAASFDADVEQVSAYKKLIDTKHPAWKALTAIKTEVVSYWRGSTLPYPIGGVRLIRRDDIATFEDRMQGFRERLAEAVQTLQNEFEAIKVRARENLGALYDSSDYPTSLDGLFQISWEYPPVEPPRYLMHFNPELYRQEQVRIQQRFEQSIALAEGAFAEQLQNLVAHLIERLADSPDGQPKVFRNSAVENFREFYTQFKNLNIRGNTELDALVTQAHDLVAGLDVQNLRNSAQLRENITRQMGEVQTALDNLVSHAPRRRLMRMD